jgi:hypothetical protein
VVGAVFSRVNITMARPKLKISRKLICFILQGRGTLRTRA